jgi:hypothetical protein
VCGDFGQPAASRFRGITTFGSLPTRDKKSLAGEAEQVATLRGASSVDFGFDTYGQLLPPASSFT